MKTLCSVDSTNHLLIRFELINKVTSLDQCGLFQPIFSESKAFLGSSKTTRRIKRLQKYQPVERLSDSRSKFELNDGFIDTLVAIFGEVEKPSIDTDSFSNSEQVPAASPNESSWIHRFFAIFKLNCSVLSLLMNCASQISWSPLKASHSTDEILFRCCSNWFSRQLDSFTKDFSTFCFSDLSRSLNGFIM